MLRSRLLHSLSRGAVQRPRHHAETVLISDDDIAQRTRELAADIRRDYAGAGQLHIVCVLKGAFMFLADLVRAIDMPVTLDFMALSSYAKGTTSSGEVRLLKDLDSALARPPRAHRRGHRGHGPDAALPAGYPGARAARNRVRTACLLSKPSRRQIDVRVEYIGFTIEDHFVVGYGLDFDERYRNLPHIAVLNGQRVPGPGPGSLKTAN